MGILDVKDAGWAWKFGLSYGAWYPELGADLQTILRAFADYAQRPLNDTAIAHGHWKYKTGRRGKRMTQEQLQSLAPYLGALGSAAAEAVEVAIYYRRFMWDTQRVDARTAHPQTPGIDRFSRATIAFLKAHPELKVYSRTVVTPEGGAPTSGGQIPPPIAVAGFAPPPPAMGGGSSPHLPPHVVSAPERVRPAPPAAQPYGVSHAGAEQLVAAWMEHLGATGVRVTQFSVDGGIDVTSRRFIAQVKNLAASSSVPVSAIRDLAGVASVDGRRAAMFTSGGYSSGGVGFADNARMALFRYDAVRGTLSAANSVARDVRREGME